MALFASALCCLLAARTPIVQVPYKASIGVITREEQLLQNFSIKRHSCCLPLTHKSSTAHQHALLKASI